MNIKIGPQKVILKIINAIKTNDVCVEYAVTESGVLAPIQSSQS